MEEMLSQMTTQVSYKNAAKMYILQCKITTQKLATYHKKKVSLSNTQIGLVYIRM